MAEDFNLHKIINLDPGWEKEWDRLYNLHLVYDMDREDQKGILTRYAEYRFSCGRDPSCESGDIESFLAFANSYYLERIKKRVLFATYSPQKWDLFVFLCNRKCLNGILRQYRKQRFTNITSLRPASSNDGDSNDNDWDFPNQALPESERVILKRRIQELFAALQENIIVHFRKTKGGHITREYTYAGLQYYPRLSQEDNATKNLHDHVQNQVATLHVLPSGEADLLIKGYHQQEVSGLTESLIAISKKMDEMRYHKGSNGYSDDCNEYFKIFKRIYLYPLSVPIVMFLLKIDKRNTVDTYHSDYTAALRVILKNYKDIYDQIKNDTYIPGDFEEEEDEEKKKDE